MTKNKIITFNTTALQSRLDVQDMKSAQWTCLTVQVPVCMLQVQEWACSLCTRGWCSLTCGGTSTSVSRWPWRSLGFSPRQQWREHRPQSSVLWSRAWRARVEGTSGTYSSFYELLSCCFLLTNNMGNHTEHSEIHTEMQHSVNGNYLSLCMLSDCAATRCSRAASDDDLAQKLWEISCNMLGITWQWTVATKPYSESELL